MKQNKRVIALGFFDGVHLGHAALLRRVVQRAEELGAIPSAITFDSLPTKVIMGHSVPLLTTADERADLMRQLYGIQDIIVAHFDDALMHMSWQDFVTDYLLTQHRAIHLVVGHDFHFGYKGEGNPERLQQLCSQLGIGCDIISPVCVDGFMVSSTYIRNLVAQGHMERAAQFLGHPHFLTDQVRHGKRLGKRLGFPTVNLHIHPGSVVPAFGVYAAKMWVDGRSICAATNVGIRPTIDDGDSITVEGTLLDFDGDLYGKTVRMELYHYLRPEQHFESLQALRAQIMCDAQQVRAYFA